VAQHAQPPDPASGAAEPGAVLRFGAHGVPLLTHARPMLAGRAMTEVYLTQPTLFGLAGAFGGRLRAQAAVSLETFTLDRGELGAGASGEGYVDRRHPHTLLHELVVVATAGAGPVHGSATIGRGFAPFGTDDPMMRPFVKFPANHHLGQVLERLVAIVALRSGPAAVELARFAGNEPLDARDVGRLDRFGDSWSARLSLYPGAGLELQASQAFVVSPELPVGGGNDQRKHSVSVRHEHRQRYALIEWHRTGIVDRGREVYAFGSVLGEVALRPGAWAAALRIERTERPEEPRAFDPFRTPWPHGDAHLLGLTTWTIASARLQRTLAITGATVSPFVEASLARVRGGEHDLFEPAAFYGGTRIATLNAGARLGAGAHPSRMGRYGVAVPGGSAVPPPHAHDPSHED
jgi:hypothetical protein